MPRSSTNQRILFVHNAPTSFVITDRNLLQERWPIYEWYQGTRRINPVALGQAVRQCDLIFCWFASWHSFTPVLLARLLQKPSVVVIGGYDTANVPEADYGSQRGGLPRLIARLVISQATHLIALSHHARREAIAMAQADPQKITVIYQGLAPLPMGQFGGRQRLALTVGNVWRENLWRKGLLPFAQAAAHLPDLKFVHVGQWRDDSIEVLRRVASPNVEFKGYLPDEALTKLYSQASIYVQASLHEGFGMSVAEAMLAGCIPVVTRRGALPEVVGDTGIYAESNDPLAIATAIRQALALDGATRWQARERILAHFSLEYRRQALHTLIGQLLE